MGLIIVKIKQKCGICNKNGNFYRIFFLKQKYDTEVFHKHSLERMNLKRGGSIHPLNNLFFHHVPKDVVDFLL